MYGTRARTLLQLCVRMCCTRTGDGIRQRCHSARLWMGLSVSARGTRPKHMSRWYFTVCHCKRAPDVRTGRLGRLPDGLSGRRSGWRGYSTSALERYSSAARAPRSLSGCSAMTHRLRPLRPCSRVASSPAGSDACGAGPPALHGACRRAMVQRNEGAWSQRERAATSTYALCAGKRARSYTRTDAQRCA